MRLTVFLKKALMLFLKMLPASALGGSDTLATLGSTQTFTGAKTFTNTLDASGTTVKAGTFHLGTVDGFWNADQIKLKNTQAAGWVSVADGVNGAIDSAFIRVSAGVVKLTTIFPWSVVRALFGGGAAVASAAALPVPTGSVFHVTGTTNITSVLATNFESGVLVTLIFDGILTVTDGSNLKLNGNYVTSADDTLTLVYDGTNWYEVCRSVN